MVRYNELFRFNDSNLETFVNKPSNVLKAKLGEDYKEVLKARINSQTPSKELVKKALKCKWDSLDSETRISLFDTINSDIFKPNEDGHTIFYELSSQVI